MLEARRTYFIEGHERGGAASEEPTNERCTLCSPHLAVKPFKIRRVFNFRPRYAGVLGQQETDTQSSS